MDLAAVKERVNLVDICGRYVALKRKSADTYVGCCCFHNERTGSFTVFASERRFHCFGCKADGDCFDFVFRLGVASDYVEAVEYFNLKDVVQLAGKERLAVRDSARKRQLQTEQDNEQIRKKAYAIWHDQGQHPAETWVEGYLRGRGYTGEINPRAVRFHPALWCKEARAQLPAMIAAIENAQGRFMALHRTWLARMSDGSIGKAQLEAPKKVWGRFAGGAIRLHPPGAFRSRGFVDGGRTLWVGEGIETTYSIVEGLGRRPELLAGAVVWAGVSLTNMSRLNLPLADNGLTQAFERVVLVMDNDMKDTAAGLTEELYARSRWEDRGIEVVTIWPPRGMDLNDVLTGSAGKTVSPAIAGIRADGVLGSVLEAFPGATITRIDGRELGQG